MITWRRITHHAPAIPLHPQPVRAVNNQKRIEAEGVFLERANPFPQAVYPTVEGANIALIKAGRISLKTLSFC
jgi:hypothetical protein